MTNLNLLIPIVKPMLKPTLKGINDYLCELISSFPVNDGDDLVFMIAKKGDKMILLPAILDSDNKCIIGTPELNALLNAQTLSHFILNNFNKALSNDTKH